MIDSFEERFIAAVIKDDTDERRRECLAIPPDAFRSEHCRAAWAHVVASKDYFEAAAGPARSFFGNTTIGADYPEDRWRLICSLLHERGPEYLAELSKFVGTGKNRLLARLENRRFDIANPPPEPVPRFRLKGKGISTPGNISVLQAQAGTGKTSFLAAFLSARICAQNETQHDTLSITADGQVEGVLIWIDTEQSLHDEHQQVVRGLRRAGVIDAPSWLRAYPLADFSAVEMRSAVSLLLEQFAGEGIFAIIVDGVADLVRDVNDAEECNGLVAELHAAAIKYDCPVVCVLHENPGQENGKGRGHLGSQLVRKAETVLRLVKTDEVTAVFSHKARQSPVLERDGVRFSWSSENGMHMSAPTGSNPKDDAKREKMRDLAEGVFVHVGKDSLTYTEMLKAISGIRSISASTAEDRFSDMKRLGVISKKPFSGEWMLTNPVTP